jgi:oligopeptide/dipeptide ABC transporter ATP-binding protein
MDLQEQMGLTYLFIAHNLGVIEHFCTRVAVMYLGQIVEMADTQELYGHPVHPYTQALLSAVPVISREHRRERIRLTGEVPSPLNPPSGCRFHPRCPYAMDRCKTEMPKLKDLGGGHWAACHLTDL